MTTLTITAKGQITLKRDLLRALGVGPGDKVDLAPAPGGGLTIRAVEQPATRTIEGLIGSLHNPARPAITIEEMNEVIARSWAGEYDL